MTQLGPRHRGGQASTSSADQRAYPEEADQLPVEELARRQGVRPIRSAHELAREGIFESDEELDEFLADLHAFRHSDLSS